MMSPNKEINETIGGIVAKYQQEFGIEIYAYIFLSNHYHLLVRAPRQNLWRFEQGINREIAKRINKIRGREGHFWARRYDDQLTLQNTDALVALVYIVCNAVKHRLVKDACRWPGFGCFFHLFDEKDRTYFFTDYSAYKKAKQRARITGEAVYLEDFKIPYLLKLSPLPMFASLTKKVRRQHLRTAIQKQITLLNAEAKKEKKGYLGQEGVLAQDPNARPRKISRRNRPLCYTQDPEAKHLFLTEVYFPWTSAYIAASTAFRSGILDALFPPHCIKPPLLYLID